MLKVTPSRFLHCRVSCPPQPTLPQSIPSPQDRHPGPRTRHSRRLSPSPQAPLLASGSTAEAPAPPQDPAFSLLTGPGLLAAEFSLVKTDARHPVSRLRGEPAPQSLQLANSDERFLNGPGRRSSLQLLLANSYCQSCEEGCSSEGRKSWKEPLDSAHHPLQRTRRSHEEGRAGGESGAHAHGKVLAAAGLEAARKFSE